MDVRLIVKQFIDMDELSEPWNSSNKLYTPVYVENKDNYKLIDCLKKEKENYLNIKKENKRVLKK